MFEAVNTQHLVHRGATVHLLEPGNSRAQAIQAAFGLPNVVQLLAGDLWCNWPVSCLVLTFYAMLWDAAGHECHCF